MLREEEPPNADAEEVRLHYPDAEARPCGDWWVIWSDLAGRRLGEGPWWSEAWKSAFWNLRHLFNRIRMVQEDITYMEGMHPCEEQKRIIGRLYEELYEIRHGIQTILPEPQKWEL